MKRHLTSLFKKRPSALETKYQEQIKQDSETISKSVKALVILIAILETIRVVVSEIILKGPIRWDEVFTYLSFSVFLCVLVLGKVIFAEKIPNEYKKYTKIISPICVLCYCGIITFVLIRQLESYVRDFSDQRDSFDFIGIGLLVIPNLIISDVLFNHWFLKCLLPLWQLLNLAVILTQYDPLNLAALLFMIFEFSFDIVLIFWIKDNLRWRVFLQRMAANQWNQIHSEILKNIPDNVAVYDFNGTLLFENEFFKSLREKIGSEDVVKIVRGIKKRGKFDSLKSYVIIPMRIGEFSNFLISRSLKRS